MDQEVGVTGKVLTPSRWVNRKSDTKRNANGPTANNQQQEQER
jgi:hypothetical protein